MTDDLMRIGTSGFGYRDWLGGFYPQFCPQADFLRYYASQFDTVELDTTFYRIPTKDMIGRWVRATPGRFLFTAKFPRTVTHEGDLKSRLQNAESFVRAMRGMGEKRGPLLLQFPYDFKPDQAGVLSALLETIPADVDLAVELRNRSWLKRDEHLALMRQRHASYCLIDHPWMPRQQVATSDTIYVRLLGDRRKIASDFSHTRFDREDDLEWWRGLVERFLMEGKRVLIYVNNHYSGHAPATAQRLRELLRG